MCHVTGIEFYIGLPRELNYRVGRYFTDGSDLAGIRSFIRSMMDETNRLITWRMMTGKGLLKQVIDNCQDAFADVSFITIGNILKSP